MSLIRHTPRGMTPWFDFDRLFEDFGRGPNPAPLATAQDWSPAVDIYEDDKAITLTADLPDMDEKDLDVRVEENHLNIKGERKFVNEENKDNYRRIERRYGSFQRIFALPENVDAEKIKAKYDKGALKVTLPKVKVESPKTRTIPVA